MESQYWLTYEGEGRREDEEHAVAVHREGEGKVSGQTAPYEELVHCSPVVSVQAELKTIHNFTVQNFDGFFFGWGRKGKGRGNDDAQMHVSSC